MFLAAVMPARMVGSCSLLSMEGTT